MSRDTTEGLLQKITGSDLQGYSNPGFPYKVLIIVYNTLTSTVTSVYTS